MSIVAESLGKSFGSPKVHVLQDLTFEIKKGEFVSISGRSGSGKSTLLYLLSTLDVPTCGTLSIMGRDPHKMGVHELHQFRNEHIGFVFQFHYLLPELTALENILMPARKSNQEQIKMAAAMELLGEFGIADKVDRLPSQLSGGEQQRVAIARALILSPSIIFADEPTGNLDTANGEIVMDLLCRTNKNQGTTLVLVTHEPEFAARASRQITLVDGRLRSP